MPGKTDIVVTTIWEPAWLAGYLENLRAHGHDGDTTIRIVCDRKTPASVYAAAAAARNAGFKIDCPTLDEQAAYLTRLGLPDDFIPWNSDNRRNIGFLRAWESGADVLISIDDDNYCGPDTGDFVGAHRCVGQPVGRSARQAAGGAWYNICSMLHVNRREAIYPRGFPYAARHAAGQAELLPLDAAMSARTVALNAGLWLDDPDVDALTRLTLSPRVTGAEGEAVVLSETTWSPINTQNTGLMRAALPAYYYVRMGFALQGMKIDRFGDILSGYFVQKCAKHLGHAIRVGSPIAFHRRTAHNLFVDLYHELAGIVLVEELAPWLQEQRLNGSDYATASAALAEALEAQADQFRGFVWDQGGREFLKQTARCMRTWLDALTRLG